MFVVSGFGIGACSGFHRIRRIVQQGADFEGSFKIPLLVSRNMSRVGILLKSRKLLHSGNRVLRTDTP